MNPLVSEMLNAQAGQDAELRFLEDLLNDDCKCEFPHNRSKCTVEVTHLLLTRCGLTPRRICLGAATSKIGVLTRVACARCGETASDCWEIRPI